MVSMKKIKILVLATALLITGSSAVALADNTCSGVKTAVINCGSDGGIIKSFLITVVNFLAVGVGLAVVTGIVVGAVMYTTAAGSADQAKKGIGYIRNAVIALLLFIFLSALVNFLVPGGLF